VITASGLCGEVMLPIKVISLDKSEARRNIFNTMNGGLNYEFISAVDGSLLDEKTTKDSKLFETGLNYSAGAMGNALSHLRLWESAIADNRALTVAEDDVIFRDDFPEKSDSIISLLPEDWDIIVWGWNFDDVLCIEFMPDISKAVMIFNQSALRNSILSFKELKTSSIPMRLDKCLGTPAYSISPIGAKKFKGLCFPLSPFTLQFPLINRPANNLALDCMMNKIYPLTESYVCFPPLAVTKNETETSTVQIKNSPTSGLS